MNKVIWITGFSGSGKSTLAYEVKKILKKNNSIVLDGDGLRDVLECYGYDRADRLKLAYSYARLAQYLSQQGFVVIVATISMFEEVRVWNRVNIKNYFEVYLKVTESIRANNDSKGLFVQKLEMVDQSKYEEPKAPDLIFEDWQTPIDQMALKIAGQIEKR